MVKKIYCISAGHNPAGKIACGASDLLDESTEARKITKEVIKLLRKKGYKVYNCTTNRGSSQSDVLKKVVSYHNKQDAVLNISIHLNSGRNDKTGDNKIAGTEALVYSNSGIKKEVSEHYLKEMEKLGFTNRGIKIRKDLYFLKKTTNPSILIEVCFVDDKDDYNLYQKVGYKRIAQAIVNAILYK